MREVRKWHRRVGIAAAVFMVAIAVTGVLLNHTLALRLADRTVTHEWLMALYGVAQPPPVRSFLVGRRRISQVADRIYLDAQAAVASSSPLAGAIAVADGYLIATKDRLFLVDSDGVLIEAVQTGFDDISAIGHAPGHPVAVRRAGSVLAALPADLNRWHALGETAAVVWSTPVVLSRADRSALTKLYQGPGFNLERILLDLHSGRLFGPVGVWLVDAVAIISVVLAVTGIWLWSKSRGPR